MTIQAMEKAIENLEYKVAKLEFEVYEQRRTIGQLIIEKADRKTEPQRGCDADCNEDCTECAKETELWKAEQTEPQTSGTPYKIEPSSVCKDEPQTDCETCRHYNPHHEAIACERCLDGKYNHYEPKDEPQTDCAWQNDEHIPTELASTMLKERFKEQK